MLRADEHKKYFVSSTYKNYIIKFLEKKNINYCCISDYNKGAITDTFLSKIFRYL